MNIVEIVTAERTFRHEFDSLRDARAYVASWHRNNRGIAADITISGDEAREREAIRKHEATLRAAGVVETAVREATNDVTGRSIENATKVMFYVDGVRYYATVTRADDAR